MPGLFFDLVSKVSRTPTSEPNVFSPKTFELLKASSNYFPLTETVNLFRPLARRRDKTARPSFVAMRARNPWVVLRRLLLGWYVRFITNSWLSFLEVGNKSQRIKRVNR